MDANAVRADLSDWEEAGHRPPMGSLADPAFLRMYGQAGTPRAGALVSDELDIDGPWHFHDMHQLVCAFEGGIEVETAGGRHLVPRQLAAWIPAGAAHRMSLRRVRSGSIFFPRAMVAGAGERIRTVFVSPLMREMAREAMRWPLAGPDSALRRAFYEAMAGLCAEWIGHEADLYLPTSADPRLQRAMDHVASRPDDRLSDVCRHAGMSERSLRRHLKQATGMTLEAYRRRSRLIRAVSLLSETDEPIAGIALSCGFESQSAFARAFRAAMAEAPGAYRDRMRAAAT